MIEKYHALRERLVSLCFSLQFFNLSLVIANFSTAQCIFCFSPPVCTLLIFPQPFSLSWNPNPDCLPPEELPRNHLLHHGVHMWIFEPFTNYRCTHLHWHVHLSSPYITCFYKFSHLNACKC